MKLVAIVALFSLAALLSSGCEYHRRLEEARRRREDMQRAAAERLRQYGQTRLRQEQERAYEDVRESIYGDRAYPSSDGSHGGSHSDHSPSYRTYSRHSSSSSIPSYRRTSLPGDSRFCGDSNEYFCNVNADCVKDENTGGWKCRYTQRHTVHRRPVISHHGGSERENRYYPHVRRPSVTSTHSSVPRFPNYVTHTTYKCGTGLKRVNISSTSFRCVDIDECETEANLCEETCVNTLRSFYCTCGRGYEVDGKYRCKDRDECSYYNGICGVATCVNTEGSYDCNCSDGYRKLGQRRCEDINECEELNPCEEGEICFNKWGSYSCDEPTECTEGYARSATNDDLNSDCILQDVSSSNTNQPTSISYRKILVEARKRNSNRPLGTMSFSSPDSRYTHRYSVRILEGSEYFWYRKHSSSRLSNTVTIDFYNRVDLNPEEEYQLSLLITDSPSLRYSTYGYNSYKKPPTSSRRVEMTIVPQAHGGYF